MTTFLLIALFVFLIITQLVDCVLYCIVVFRFGAQWNMIPGSGFWLYYKKVIKGREE